MKAIYVSPPYHSLHCTSTNTISCGPCFTSLPLPLPLPPSVSHGCRPQNKLFNFQFLRAMADHGWHGNTSMRVPGICDLWCSCGHCSWPLAPSANDLPCAPSPCSSLAVHRATSWSTQLSHAGVWAQRHSSSWRLTMGSCSCAASPLLPHILPTILAWPYLLVYLASFHG